MALTSSGPGNTKNLSRDVHNPRILCITGHATYMYSAERVILQFFADLTVLYVQDN